jgi:hypothetical protein
MAMDVVLAGIGMQTVTFTKIKYVVNVVVVVSLAVTVAFAVVGCSDKGKQAARNIVEEHTTDFYANVTKGTKASTESSSTGSDSGGFGSDFKYTVDINGAKIVDTKEQIQYNGLSFQIEDLNYGDTIYDVNKVLSQTEADEFCKYLLDGNGTIKVEPDGTCDTKGVQLLFIKCKIKNNSTNEYRCNMAPNACACKNGDIWGKSEILIYDFFGRHDPYTNTKTGIANKTTHLFQPGEELETVFVLGIFQYGKPSKCIFGYKDEGVDIYLSTEFLSNRSPGGKLAYGSYLFPIYKGGELVK